MKVIILAGGSRTCLSEESTVRPLLGIICFLV
jgi:hypothetical protein